MLRTIHILKPLACASFPITYIKLDFCPRKALVVCLSFTFLQRAMELKRQTCVAASIISYMSMANIKFSLNLNFLTLKWGQ